MVTMRRGRHALGAAGCCGVAVVCRFSRPWSFAPFGMARTFGPAKAPQPWDPTMPEMDPAAGREDPYDLFGLDDSAASYTESYNSMIAGSAWTGDWEAALESLQDMRMLGVPPDVTSYFAAICACRRGGAWQKALELVEEMWKKDLEPDVECYCHAIRACREAGEEAEAQKLLKELRSWGTASEADRFHTTPEMKWMREMKQYGCSVRNVLNWRGQGALPKAPPRPCWLLPNQDDVAVKVAEHQAQLRHAGWKVVSVSSDVVLRLSNKAELMKYAKQIGLEAAIPRTYHTAEEAVYPCILKPALGTFGKDTHVVRSSEEVHNLCRNQSLAPKWVLQELIPGRLEHSTTLLVLQGEVVDYVDTLYEYDGEEYVWPHVEEVRHEYRSIPEEHLNAMRRLLADFSGICCLGYKLREDGSICIFEVNPRIGGDLVFEIPKPRARAMFEKLDAMFT
eukprot:TRINITY_DN29228_c0_g1_i1.p1 TRINITY_DN29228_c0_g1~~TRINITY_DN29228_c0_g1_i1.p1  ORF type:complete len:460 (-),score=89.40 TRINITY_DN29228_c0_g1_i1:2-1354(-)